MSKTLNFVVTKDLERKLQKLAKHEQRSVSAQLRVIIQDWFSLNEIKEKAGE